MGGKKRNNPVTDEQIITAYQAGHSALKIAALFGIGDTTVYRVLRKAAIPSRQLSDYQVPFFTGQEAQIRAWYDAGETVAAILERLGCGSYWSVKEAIRRAGGTLRPNPAPTLERGELEEIKRLHDLGLGQIDISLQLGRSQSFISRAMRRNGIATHYPAGATHPKWKGGRSKAGEYMRVLLSPDDPYITMANHAGYVLEHRVVMARKLGRVLRPTETVHHIDGDTLHNAPENLQLRQGRHGKGSSLVCLDCGSHNIGPAALKES